MQFLRTAFWVVVAVAIALFCKANNRPLDIKIWGDIIWQTRIWFPMVLAFLLGAVPLWIVGRAARWSHKRRVDSLERALATATAAAAPDIVATPSVPATGLTPAPAFSAEPAPSPLPPPNPTGPA
ncbi:MAG: hypothetical protein ABW164_08090 [Sphingobium sp.]